MNEQFEKSYKKAEATGNLDELETVLKNINTRLKRNAFTVSSALKHQLQSETCTFEMVNLLLKHGADPNFDSDDGLPLQIAVLNPHITLKVVQVLLKYGAFVVGNFDDEDHSTVLRCALQNSNINLDIVKLLLKHNLKVNNGLHCHKHDSLLRFVVCNSKCNSKFVKLLLKYGADVNATSDRNSTPLYLALMCMYLNVSSPSQCINVIDTLLMNGADMNISNFKNITPLQDVLKRHCDMRRYVDSHSYGYDTSQLYCNRTDIGSLFSEDHWQIYALDFSTRSMLKHIVIRKTDCDFEQISNSLSDTICEEFLDDKCCRIMKSHHFFPSLRELLEYLICCVQEVAKMKKDLISFCFTLQEFILFRDKLTFEKIYIHMDEIFRVLTEDSYPIYRDVIVSVIKKKHILTKLNNTKIYPRSGLIKEKGHKKQVYLDPTSVSHITQFLSKNDLLRLALACYLENREGSKNKRKKCHICLEAPSCNV